MARLFAFLTIAVPTLWTRDAAALPYLAALGVLWLVAAWVDTRDLPAWLSRVDLVEAALVGTLCALALPSSEALVAALALPPFISALRHGFDGTASGLAAELVALVVVAAVQGGGLDSREGVVVFTWAVTGLGLGLVAGFFTTSQVDDTDGLAAYREARDLIRGLHGLSAGLSSGLDPVVLGDELLDTLLDRVPAAAIAVHIPRDDALTPLTRRAVDEAVAPVAADLLAESARTTGSPVVEPPNFAVPLRVDSDLVCVVSGVLAPSTRLDRHELERILGETRGAMVPTAVRLDTALLFSAFRDSATADERRRLAREMHDGVAQDIASLGYLVDSAIAAPPTPQQLQLLRDSITRIVAEVRRSVLTLRSSVDGAESLGTAISALARQLSTLSGTPIQVTVDEHTTRLRPEVEAEVMRIAQEAMNNAVKHAEASQIDVLCQVDPPGCWLEVTDNGRGLQQGRADSHGLQIMEERSRLVGGELDVADRRQGGTRVSFRIASGAGH